MGSNTSAGHPRRRDGEAGQRSVLRATGPASVYQWRRVFAGEERQLRELRRWLASLLPDCPVRDDVTVVANELAGNALLHTSSGSGGQFAVEITRCRAVIRVAVADGGGTTEPHLIEAPASAEHGRGLLLVRGLSKRAGVAGDERGRVVWAEVAWDDPDGVIRASASGHPAASIWAGQAPVARRLAWVVQIGHPPNAHVKDGQQVDLAAVGADRAADGLAVRGGLLCGEPGLPPRS